MIGPGGRAEDWPEPLVTAFRTAHFDVFSGPRPVTLSLDGVEPGGRTLDEPLAVVTAWNPGVSRPERAVNERANVRLEARLRSQGLRYVRAAGRSPDGLHEEPSFAVFDIGPGEARALAEEFGQAAVFFWDGRHAHLEWCRPPEKESAWSAFRNPS